MNLKTTRGHKGVTLVDLILCVMIMGILAAVGAPRFASTIARLRCEAVAKRIAGDLNYSRRVAIQTSRTSTITFRSSPAGYDMNGVEHPYKPSVDYSVDLSEVDDSVVLVSANFDSGTSLTYNNYGRPMVGNLAMVSGSVTLRSGAHTFVVVVIPTTGEAEVQ